MKQGKGTSADSSELRRRAEKQLKRRKAGSSVARTAEETKRLLHELQVHQIELEMQNEELKLAREETETALERYTELYDFAPVGYFTLKKNGIISSVNLTGARLLQTVRSSVIGERFDRFIAVEDRPVFHAFLRNVFENQGRESCEVGLQKKGDQPFIVRIEGDGESAMQQCHAVVMDITERKRHEEALRESEEKMRSAFASAAIGFAMTTPDGRFLDANVAYCRITGYSIEELRTLAFPQLIHPDDRAENMVLINRMLAGELVDFTIENRYLRKGGEVAWVRKSVSLVRSSKGTPRWIIALIEDIADRRRAEDALQRSRAGLEKRVKKRTREVANSQEQLRNLYSHVQSLREEERTAVAREIHDDLGQALTAIKMDLSWLATQLPDDYKGLRERLKADVDQVDNTIQIVKRVCTELRPGLLDHLGLAAAIEWQCAEVQKRAGVKCNIVVDPEDMEVNADLKITLFRVAQEALTNVLKHSKATEVRVSLKRMSNGFVLEVEDNGVGIREKEISKPNSFGIVGMRERLHPWKGKLTVSGTRNKGTTLQVTIPLTPEDSS